MKRHITVNTIVNEVVMESRSRRPRAVFLASDETDVELLETLLTRRECRVLQAHSRENAAKAFEILVKSGWEGVVVAVNSGFAPPMETEVAAEAAGRAFGGVSIEGLWDQIQARGGILSGQRVRVTVLDDPERNLTAGDPAPASNMGMLGAISAIKNIVQEIKPNTDKANYLNEAREGAMYGFGCDD
jgi:hypothetical protein